MKERLLRSLKTNLMLSGIFLFCYLTIRLFTWISISGRLTSEIGSLAPLQVSGFVEDIGVAISIGLFVLAIGLLIGLASVKLSAIVSYVSFAVALLLGFAVNQFFVVTLTPLSADLFGYSLNDVGTTVGSSGSTLAGAFAACLVIIVTFVLVALRMITPSAVESIRPKVAIGIAFMLAVFYFMPWRIHVENYENDLRYYVAANKLRFLTNRTIDWMADQSDKHVFPNGTYPFLHQIHDADSLGKYFNPSDRYPNLVIVIVEGLGRDFCGANAPYGGFTPFLDSLSRKSLYWENAISNAGRTFGAPPSILGSLPYARLGMMGYGGAMPGHQTLISLLKPFGYTTNFFYGGNPNFDNLDLFLERQQIDFFLNESNFPTQKKKAFWGYNDTDLFTTALQEIADQQGYRLDVFLTLNTHEPFVCPDSAIAALARKKMDKLPHSERKEIMSANGNVFECLLYADDAIKKMMLGYSKRHDFNNTVFIITGDHRLIPVPQANKIKRYHVPIMIYSPLLKQSKTFSSLTTHSAILPTMLNFLRDKYGMNFPDELPTISRSLPERVEFSSTLDIALIRNKNEVKDYVLGNYFLSEDRLYTILPDMNLRIESNDVKKKELKEKLKAFQAASIYAFENNRLDKIDPTPQPNLFSFTRSEEDYLRSTNIPKLTPDERFGIAKDLAFAKNYDRSRTILKHILNQSPNYHDARVLMARTYAWQTKYDSARLYLDQTLRRSPRYADCYVALSDIEYWQSQVKNSLLMAESGLKINPIDVELLARKARALVALNQNREAKKILSELNSKGIDNEIISQLKKQLK